MYKLRYLFAALLIVGGVFMAKAQDKVGVCNVEFVLSKMPETATMNQALSTYRAKLGEALQIKQENAQLKFQAYQEKAESGASEEELQPMVDELTQLDEELRQAAADSDEKLMTKRAQLMEPISEKINKAIQAVANENGYTFILNSMDGSGVSIVISIPEEDNVTGKVMEKLGIQVDQASSSGK